MDTLLCKRLFSLLMVTKADTYENILSEFNHLKTIVNEDNDPELDDCLIAINEEIKQYDLEILRGKSEVTGEDHLVLALTSKHPIAQKIKCGISNKHNVALLRCIIQSCAQSSSGFTSETDCINLNVQCEMTKSAAQNALGDLALNKWLEIKDGNVFIGIRSILELGSVIRESYSDGIKNCPLCQKYILYGAKCQYCEVVSHIHCLDKFLKRMNHCPHCKETWKEQNEGTTMTQPRSQRSHCSQKSGIKRPRHVIVSDDDSE